MIAAAFVILLSSGGAWNGWKTLAPRSDKARAADWTVASLIASSVAITCIPNRSNAADQPLASLFLLIPGYRLGNSSFYKPFEQDFGEAIGKDHSRASFVFIDEDGTDDSDLTRSAEAILRSINFHDFDIVCIAGHSRGGAVATSVLAALLGGKLKKGAQDKIKKGSTLGLLLIDPVDDGATTSLRQLSQTLEELGPSTPIPVKTLIVSTSFGGSVSSYYKTKIASACAPEQRNAPAFRDSFAK
jgi:pimeloyl-ACP methyl ester carboxylesterase